MDKVKFPKIKKWFALIDDPDAAVQTVSLYSEHFKGSSILFEMKDVPHFLSGVNSMLIDYAMKNNWMALQRIKLLNELETANARIKELEGYINNAGER